MSVAPNVVPIVIAAVRRRIFRTFRSAGATSEASAIDFEPRGFIDRRQFDRMRRAGVVLGDSGRFWIDENRASEWNSSRRKRALVAIAATLTAGAIAMALAPK